MRFVYKIQDHWLILALLITLSSCQERTVEKFELTTYYPNEKFFEIDDSDVRAIGVPRRIDFKDYTNFDVLIDSIETSVSYSEKPYFILKTETKRYFLAVDSWFCGLCDRPPFPKPRNILTIDSDSIFKFNKNLGSEIYPILSKDLLNYGKDSTYSKLPQKLLINVTADLSKLENRLTELCIALDRIKQSRPKTPFPTIQINRSREVFNILPLP